MISSPSIDEEAQTLATHSNSTPSVDVNRQIDEFKRLYAEFQTFRNLSEFHKVGYGACCRYGDWADRVNALNKEATYEFTDQTGLTPYVLWYLGKAHYSDFPREGFIEDADRAIQKVVSGEKNLTPLRY